MVPGWILFRIRQVRRLDLSSFKKKPPEIWRLAEMEWRADSRSVDNLANSAQGFRRGANRVRKQMWWKDMKMRMCLVGGIVILLVIIIVPVVITYVWPFELGARISRNSNPC